MTTQKFGNNFHLHVQLMKPFCFSFLNVEEKVYISIRHRHIFFIWMLDLCVYRI